MIYVAYKLIIVFYIVILKVYREYSLGLINIIEPVQ